MSNFPSPSCTSSVDFPIKQKIPPRRGISYYLYYKNIFNGLYSLYFLHLCIGKKTPD